MARRISPEDGTIPGDRGVSVSPGIVRLFLVLLLSFFNLLFLPAEEGLSAEKTQETIDADASVGMEITTAVICEEVQDGRPVNEGVIFSSGLNSITCFTEFSRIEEKTTIYHCWYFKENLRAKRKPLVLNPPKWSTFSQIEPRETDKGPWRVDIVDEKGNILKTLRFSIID